jgi:peptidoglycan/LPS O-acetylase OafA/YrhL
VGARQAERNLPLDGLRALAALSVLLYHVAGMTTVRGGALGAALSELNAGVAVFFVISGFVIYRPFARAIGSGSRLPGTLAFYRRRAARILPAYWVVLTLWLVALAVAGGGGPSGDWAGYYGLVQGYSSRTVLGGLGPAWSLCIEVAFYAVLPVLAFLIARLAGGRRQLLVIAVLGVCSLGLRVAFSGSLFGLVPTGRIVPATALPAMFDWFALGMAIAVVVVGWEAGQPWRARLRGLAARPGLCWLLAGALFVGAAPFQQGNLLLSLDSVVSHVLIGLAGALLLLPAATWSQRDRRGAGRTSPVLAALSSRPAVWLGTVSYGVFLLNLPVVKEVRALTVGVPVTSRAIVDVTDPTTVLAILVLTVAVTVALAAASWYLVELPAQRWARPRTPLPPSNDTSGKLKSRVTSTNPSSA